eukprot:6203948-Pleurochrysis_carterae.AAC.1
MGEGVAWVARGWRGGGGGSGEGAGKAWVAPSVGADVGAAPTHTISSTAATFAILCAISESPDQVMIRGWRIVICSTK